MHANTQPKGRAKLIIYKRKRRLELWLGDACHAVYPVALGFASSGPKQSEGDGRTPEGTYAICTRNAQSRFYLSLGISYPNAADAQKALEQGRIDETAYQRIVLAHRAQRRPPWDTPLGGAIMIHGHGSQKDWTHGCIAVEDEAMDVLWAHAALGTTVLIFP